MESWLGAYYTTGTISPNAGHWAKKGDGRLLGTLRYLQQSSSKTYTEHSFSAVLHIVAHGVTLETANTDVPTSPHANLVDMQAGLVPVHARTQQCWTVDLCSKKQNGKTRHAE